MDARRLAQTLIRATIRTMNPAQPEATAMLCEAGRVAVVGEWDDVQHAASANAEVLDLRGATVLPGFIDSHNHMLWTGMRSQHLDLAGSRSIAELGTRLQRFASSREPGSWITSSEGWFIEDLAEHRMPTREELDNYCADYPVYLPRLGHSASVNSLGLHLAGLHAGSPDAAGGHIGRRPDGEPSGILLEQPAMRLVAQHVPSPTEAELREALVQVQREYHRKGVTGVIDPALTAAEMDAYRQAHRDESLTVRTTMMPLLDPALPDEQVDDWLASLDGPTGRGDEQLRLGAIKVFLDGIVSMETAWVRDAYPGRCHHGTQVVSVERLGVVADRCARRGWSLGIHAIGGLAIDTALAVLTSSARGDRLSELRCSLIHAYLGPTAANMRLASEWRIGLAAQPQMHSWIAPRIADFWGTAAADAATPLRSWIDAGVVVAGGSDSPLTETNPLAGIHDAVTRRDSNGRVAGERERIDVSEALAMYTTAAAWLSFADHERGALVTGRLADWVALDGDPLTAAPEDLPLLRVLETRVGNRSVHDIR